MAKVSKSQQRLTELEKEIKRRGVRLGYERLEYAGLRLKSGLCWFRGSYYLFVDRLKAVPERLELLQSALEELDDLAAQGRLDSPLLAEAQEVLEASGSEPPAPVQEGPPPAAERGQAVAEPQVDALTEEAREVLEAGQAEAPAPEGPDQAANPGQEAALPEPASPDSAPAPASENEQS